MMLVYKDSRTFEELLHLSPPPCTVFEHEESIVDGVHYAWVHHLIHTPEGGLAYSTGVENVCLTKERSVFLTVLAQRKRGLISCGDEPELLSK